ncbi:helix-turn-helix domain-containing protein [Daejeonella oryzae]|uniref:helix-turn-helix domain-containing protein n=1 Tax=Daejeonella oryzae TaxID=1122943 RepID=UPI0003FFF625|nr:helix-turn-helix transcriptional regulator [Daejeonella oryzae]
MRTPQVNSEAIANRFAQFRKQFIAKSQDEAGKILGVSQPTIYRFEAAKAGITVEVIRILIKSYHLNIDWLTEGKGQMQDKEETKSTLVTDVNQIKVDIESHECKIKIMQKNITSIGKQVDSIQIRQNERLEALEQRLRELV